MEIDNTLINMKTLSVVIPNYNNERYLPECIDSVLAQTYPIEEIVIYDDVSTDNSRELLKQYEQKYPDKIRLILAEQNHGVSTARDIAIRSCHSDYVTTLDADDYYYDNDKLKREMDCVNKADKVSCAFSQTVLVDEQGKVCGNMEMQDLQRDFRFRTVTQSIGIYVARDIVMPLKEYIEVGGFVRDMKLFEDWDLSLKLLSKCDFYFSGGYGTAYRQKNTGLSQVSQRKITRGKVRAFKQGGEFLQYTMKEKVVFYTRTYLFALMDALRGVLKR